MKLMKSRPLEVPTFFEDFFTDMFDRPFGELINRKPINSPAVNVVEEDDRFLIELAAPGLEKGDFDLMIDKNSLVVKVEKESEKEEVEEKFTRREFNYTRFSRSFHLPETVDSEAISAEYNNGVLKIQLPKVDAAKALPVRTVEIK
jgi:HSP20 family protein